MIYDGFLSRDVAAPDLPVYAVQAHKEIINCIDGVGGMGIGEGAPEIVTGSRDGQLFSTVAFFRALNSLLDIVVGMLKFSGSFKNWTSVVSNQFQTGFWFHWPS